MDKIYIKGVKGRGHEVMAKLVKLGGKDDGSLSGEFETSYYTISDSGNIISTTSEMQKTLLAFIATEIKLDDTKSEPKFSVGDKVIMKGGTKVFKIIEVKHCKQGFLYVLDNHTYVDESYLKLADVLNKYDPVMVSDDGKARYSALYVMNNTVYYGMDKLDMETLCDVFKYIVPHTNFDFDDLESNVKRSVI